MKRLKVAVLCGGQSPEHEISLHSACSVIQAMDREAYDVHVLGIDKKGSWYAFEDAYDFLEHPLDPRKVTLKAGRTRITIVPGMEGGPLRDSSSGRPIGPFDVIFPILHGPYGEDGTIQGLLKVLHLPFVGVGVLGSAAGMDKDVTKRLLQVAGVPVAKGMVLDGLRGRGDFGLVRERLGLPCFVKPANQGSSVGVRKVSDEAAFREALEEAFAWDSKVLVEEFIRGRELECSVLGNRNPVASLPGEIVTDSKRHAFYSYEAKYLDREGAALVIPAEVPEGVVRGIQELALRSFKALGCEGMARVDFFLLEDGRLVVNELNTIPGFTEISMYPKLWEASGLSYGALIDRLIALALERRDREEGLRTALEP